jgi:hypothetical protein
VFKLVAKSIAGLATQAEKSAAAYQFFSRQGQDLLNTIQSIGGTPGFLDDIIEDIRVFNGAVEEINIDLVEEMNDQWVLVQQIIGGIGEQILVRISPALAKAAEKIQEWVKGLDERGVLGYVDDIIDRLALGVAQTLFTIVDLARKSRDYFLENKEAAIGWAKELKDGVVPQLKEMIGPATGVSKFASGFGGLAVNKISAFGNAVSAVGNIFQGDFKKGLQDLERLGIRFLLTNPTEELKSFTKGLSVAAKAEEDLKEQFKEPDSAFNTFLKNLEDSKIKGDAAGIDAVNDLKDIEVAARDAAQAIRDAKPEPFVPIDLDALDAMKKRAEALLSSARSPLEVYNDSVAELNKLFEAGLLDQKQYSKVMDMLTKKFKDATKESDALKGSIGGVGKVINAASTAFNSVLSSPRNLRILGGKRKGNGANGTSAGRSAASNLSGGFNSGMLRGGPNIGFAQVGERNRAAFKAFGDRQKQGFAAFGERQVLGYLAQIARFTGKSASQGNLTVLA